MTWGYVAIGAGTLIAGKLTADATREAGQAAGAAQSGAAQAGIDEQRRMFEEVQKLLTPYAQAGEASLEAQQALIGLAGPEAQQQAIDALQRSPAFAALTAQGENAILQQASATGGLRGGNVQGALAQFRPRLLADLIQQQYTQLGGITQTGLGGATGLAGFGGSTATNIANLLGQQGAAMAGSALASGQAGAQFGSALGSGLSLIGYGMTKPSPAAPAAPKV